MHVIHPRWLLLVTLITAFALVPGSPALRALPAFAAPACADLTIPTGGISVSPSAPIQGQPATVNITVQNLGSCAAQGFVVQWKSDLFAPTGPSTQVPGLDAGASTTVSLNYSFPRSGDFLTIAEVDTGNSVPETNEANNLQIFAITVQAPTIDLSITKFTVVPGSPVSGTTPAVVQGRVAHVSITVANGGNTAAGPFQVDWVPGLFVPALSHQVNGLGPGATTTITFDYTYGFPATYLSTATVDSTNRVAETNEFNNSQTLQVLVEPALPDLVISDISFNPSPPIAGSVTTATLTINNQGHADAGPFQVDWSPGLFIPALSQQVNGLAEGGSTQVTFDYTYPFSWPYSSTATVDSTNRVAEIHEDNNTKTVQVNVGAATVDLTITNMTITPSSPTQGSPATVNITVTNQGNSPAGNFVVSWNPDTFGIIVPSASTLTQQVNGLGAGQSTTVSFSYSYPKFGNFRTIAQVDAFNNVVETNEANNSQILNVTVQPAPIDLQITNFTVNPASPTRASQATASITVKNVGPFPTDPFAVEWKLQSTDLFGPIVWLPGLQPNQSQTVTLTGAYIAAGNFTTQAIVDVFNNVVEPGPGAEANNTVSMPITVVPRQTTLQVTLNSLHVYNDLHSEVCVIACVTVPGDWNMVFGVLDPNASCNYSGQTINAVNCTSFSFGNPGNNSDVGVGKSFTVTLVEITPLVVGVTGLEVDKVLGVPTGGAFTGFALGFWFPPDYLKLGTFTVPGQQGDSHCANGRCFDANFTVSVISQPPPLAPGAFAARGSKLTPAQQRAITSFENAARSKAKHKA